MGNALRQHIEAFLSAVGTVGLISPLMLSAVIFLTTGV